MQEMAVSPVKSLYWEQFPPMSQRRVYCTPVYHDGLLYVLGGCSETGMPLDSVEVLDVENQTWSQLPPLPTARAGAAAVALGGQVMVLGGMNQQQTPLASVEIYHPDEGKWEPRASLGQPSMGVTTVEKGKKVECMCHHAEQVWLYGILALQPYSRSRIYWIFCCPMPMFLKFPHSTISVHGN